MDERHRKRGKERQGLKYRYLLTESDTELDRHQSMAMGFKQFEGGSITDEDSVTPAINSWIKTSAQ